MPSSSVKSCLNILRRTPPDESEEILESLALLLRPNEEAEEELYQLVDVPLKHASDPEADGRAFILCDHNRDGDSHRSPWSNDFFPPLDEGLKPSRRLRDLEVHMNEVFDCYRDLYYGRGSVSSVYLWDKGSEAEVSTSFAGVFLIKNEVSDDPQTNRGYWNSVHVLDVGPVVDCKVLYKISTTVMVSMKPSEMQAIGDTNISGSMTKQIEMTYAVTSDGCHVSNMGKMVEDMEIDMRSNMDSLHIHKTRVAIESMRKPFSSRFSSQQKDRLNGKEHMAMLNQAVMKARKTA